MADSLYLYQTRRPARLNKATELQPKDAEPQTEGTDESWEEVWERRLQTIMKSDNIVMDLNAERAQDPIGHHERMKRGVLGVGFLYDSGEDLRFIDKKEISELMKQLNWWIEHFAETYVVDDPDLIESTPLLREKGSTH